MAVTIQQIFWDPVNIFYPKHLQCLEGNPSVCWCPYRFHDHVEALSKEMAEFTVTYINKKVVVTKILFSSDFVMLNVMMVVRN